MLKTIEFKIVMDKAVRVNEKMKELNHSETWPVQMSFSPTYLAFSPLFSLIIAADAFFLLLFVFQLQLFRHSGFEE